MQCVSESLFAAAVQGGVEFQGGASPELVFDLRGEASREAQPYSTKSTEIMHSSRSAEDVVSDQILILQASSSCEV